MCCLSFHFVSVVSRTHWMARKMMKSERRSPTQILSKIWMKWTAMIICTTKNTSNNKKQKLIQNALRTFSVKVIARTFMVSNYDSSRTLNI